MPVAKSHRIALPLRASVSVKTRVFQPAFRSFDSGDISVNTA
jgi:hypothetical protein